MRCVGSVPNSTDPTLETFLDNADRTAPSRGSRAGPCRFSMKISRSSSEDRSSDLSEACVVRAHHLPRWAGLYVFGADALIVSFFRRFFRVFLSEVPKEVKRLHGPFGLPSIKWLNCLGVRHRPYKTPAAGDNSPNENVMGGLMWTVNHFIGAGPGRKHLPVHITGF